MNAFERSVNKLLRVEGGFSKHAADRGGKTNFGVTQALADRWGYDVEKLTQEQAKQIYRREFWEPLKLDSIAVLSWLVADEIFDTAVNMGAAQAVKFLQESLNAFNRGGTHYPDVDVDGVMGARTFAAFHDYIMRHGTIGVTVLLRAMNALQCMKYLNLAKNDPSQEIFVYGWVLNRAGV